MTADTNVVEISIELTPQVAAYIDQMVATGLWGDTREEVCVTLIREGIRRHWRLIEPRQRSVT
jgi:Arc/MetJ-type ribon-helix-helix transcriptional regulator